MKIGISFLNSLLFSIETNYFSPFQNSLKKWWKNSDWPIDFNYLQFISSIWKTFFNSKCLFVFPEKLLWVLVYCLFSCASNTKKEIAEFLPGKCFCVRCAVSQPYNQKKHKLYLVFIFVDIHSKSRSSKNGQMDFFHQDINWKYSTCKSAFLMELL